MLELPFAKGHGTRNDFVVFADPDDAWRLDDAQVRLLCDRRAGLGADGVLRAVRSKHALEWGGDPDGWFMDYRNADGGYAEMCGNGLRVFCRFLVEEGLAAGPELVVATRAGLRRGRLCPDGMIEATMGDVALGDCFDVTVAAGEGPTRISARFVDVGNPHLVSFLPPGVGLYGLDLSESPTWEPAGAFPAGVNCEFVQVLDEGELRMRVYERGSAETWSCGTGVVACAAVARHELWPNLDRVVVEVLGGRLSVAFDGAAARLLGPAEIVARGVVRLPERP